MVFRRLLSDRRSLGSGPLRGVYGRGVPGCGALCARMPMKSKKYFFLAVCAALLVAGLSCLAPGTPGAASAGDPAQEKTWNLRVGQMGTNLKPSMVLLAWKLGYYRDEGLNVTLAQFSGFNDAMVALTLGKMDILPYGVIPTCSFVAQGAKLTIFGGTISEGSACVTLPQRAREFSTLEAFRGKTIAVVRAETGHMFLKRELRKAGIPLSEVRFVELPYFQSVLEAVHKKQADAGITNTGFELNAKIQGLAVPFAIAQYVPDFPCCRQTCATEALERDREPYVRFQLANLRAMKTMYDNPELTVKTLAEFSGQSEEYVRYFVYDSLMRITMDPGREKVLEFYQVMKDNGDIDANTPFGMEEAIDTSVYRDALDRALERWPNDRNLQRMKAELGE